MARNLEPEAIGQLHAPVLLDEVLELLAPAFTGRESAVMVDGTLGMGGHTEAVLQRFPGVNVIGIDRDPQAIELASARLARFGDRFRAVRATYDQIDEVVAGLGLDTVDAVLMDLGVSSLQLDDDERGFSYSRPAPLDMRMDQSGGETAAQILANWSEGELARILRVYGEEKFAKRIARRIVDTREESPITDSVALAQLVRDAIPAATRRTGGHPAKRTFQALRIAVNDELTILESAVPKALSVLRVGGRLVIESYQSLEDRIVKTIFKQGSEVDIPADLPILPADMDEPALKLITRRAIQADEDAIADNPRAQSVRLRAVQINKPFEPNTRSSR
ncbi:MAG: 16S rRNA (cytosine(1402)-N(4))-methyltransferase RsmH [Actinomycetaceae bacterium]|nr:16S rRNA (cytosine(1402)-N(4))-methyltransferase RsmH [Actinomycetaceae bacterium]